MNGRPRMAARHFLAVKTLPIVDIFEKNYFCCMLYPLRAKHIRKQGGFNYVSLLLSFDTRYRVPDLYGLQFHHGKNPVCSVVSRNERRIPALGLFALEEK